MPDEEAAQEAIVSIDSAGQYINANQPALDLLGVSLDELRTSAPDRFAIRPAVEGEETALRNEWQAAGARPLVGTAGLRRADGTTVRVAYAIETTDSGFRARLWQVSGSPESRASVFTVGDVLREWRTAERRLVELTAGTPEWARTLAEVELLRGKYRDLFTALASPKAGRDGEAHELGNGPDESFRR